VEDGSSSEEVPLAKKQQLLYTEIEKLMKDFKVHRCALDFDRGFVNAELKSRAA
jgi:acid stress-induced BolA-like protein IbaG/YrbA